MSQAALDRVENVLSAGRAKLESLKSAFESDLTALADSLETAFGLKAKVAAEPTPAPAPEPQPQTGDAEAVVEAVDGNKQPLI